MELATWQAMALGMSALSMIASAGAWVYTLYDRRRKALEREVEDVERRLTRMEVAIQTLPTNLTWTEMQKDIAWIRGESRTTAAQIEGLGAGLKRVERQVGLLYENELRGKSQP